MSTTDSVEGSARRDVRRNLAALLSAAKAVFATSGVSAPAKQISDRAGVGVGTLYRHFPRRSDLIVAVLRNEVAECVSVVAELGDQADPPEALQAAVDRFAGLVRTKHGLAEALHSGDPAYDGLAAALLGDLEPAVESILERGRSDGSLTSGATAREVLIGAALLCQPVPGEDDAITGRLLRVFVGGLLSHPGVPSSRSRAKAAPAAVGRLPKTRR